MRIFCAIASLGAGGAERVLSLLVQRWHNEGYEIEIVTFDPLDAIAHYKIPPGVKVHRLGLQSRSRNFWETLYHTLRRVLALRRYIKTVRPDVIVSFVTEMNILTVFASVWLGTPTIVSERVHPDAHRVGWILLNLRRFTYRFATCLVVQTTEVANWFNEELGIKSEVIANPVCLPRVDGRGPERQKKRLVAIGRLTYQKGFDLLITAFKFSKLPGWRLDIYGEGDEREALQNLVNRLGLSGDVSLCGIVDNISEELAKCTAFVHTARYEGFPNVVVEALAQGCCVLACNSPGGVAEILQGGRYGILVEPENEKELVDALGKVMSDSELRLQYEKSAFDAVQAFEVGRIAKRWTDLFDAIQTKSV